MDADKYIIELEMQLEAYKNMRKEVIKIIESYNLGKYDYSIPPIGIIDLLNILNKVGDKKC